jgi:ribosomal protein S18 acetylase RimI-like enzyme
MLGPQQFASDDVNAIELREATQADAAALGALHVASWLEAYSGILPDEMLAGLSIEARAAMWSEILGDPARFGGAVVFVAEDGGRIVGFGSCGRQRDDALAEAGFGGEIGAIYVFRSHQKRGVGCAIMAAMARSLSAAGHEAASLWVLRENVPARAFYEGLGGEIVGEKKDARPEATLIEIAYGWRDLSRLLR